mgnify:CR=1 FL=1|tara:strand:+ start:3383 stop:3973 length:591 start_codon:yes stop_codon:yes gene_type:complete
MVGQEQFSNYEIVCDSCKEVTTHEILKEKEIAGGADLLLRCLDCRLVRLEKIRRGKIVEIPITLSDGDKSSFQKVESDHDELIRVGDRFEHSESHWEITRIEDGNERSENSLNANLIRRAWATRVDRVIIPLTITDGESSRSSSIECAPDQIFSCESLIEVDGEIWRIRAIHTGKGRTLGGRRVAEQIRRIYLHPE